MKLPLPEALELKKCCSRCSSIYDLADCFYAFKQDKDLCFSCFKDLVNNYKGVQNDKKTEN